MTTVPDVGTLLAVDAEYRRQAEAGLLRTIAPKRNNPEHESWLPVMHARHEGRLYTALYSNTERAHYLHRTHDWVVVYYGIGQCTVVTEYRGALAGKRVVRGREPECLAYYRSPAASILEPSLSASEG
jgi:hypothetical protein